MAAALSGVLERFDNMLKDGSPVTGREDLTDIFEKLGSEIRDMEYLFKNPNTNPITTMFLELAYDIENAVEWHLVQDQDNISSGGGGLIKSLLKRCSGRKPNDLVRLGERIDDLKRKLRLFVIHLGHTTTTTTSSSTIIRSNADADHVVGGIEDERSTLVSMLLDRDGTHWPGIAITGLVGVAKTNLAKTVFNDPRVRCEFEDIAWAWVGEEFRQRDVLETLLIDLGFLQSELIKKMEIIELMEHLYDHLHKRRRKCLIVLDDIWSKDVWECIRNAFPKGHGNRVIVTTQFQKVARHFKGKVYKARTTVERLELFKMHSGILLDDSDKPQIKETVDNILSQCQDFQLAIVEVAKFLKGKKLEDWNDMQHFQQGAGAIPDSRILDVLSSTYNQMSPHLKPFFIYLGQFPPDHLIPVEKLCLMMMADGLISNTSYNKGMDMIESCLTELTDRSLVLMVENDQFADTRGLNTCRVNNLIHYLCIKIGMEEEFFQVADVKNNKILRDSIPNRHKRIALYYHLNDMDSSLYIPKSYGIRSLLLFVKDNSTPKSKWPEQIAVFDDFEWIRVLDFDGVDFRATKLPKNIDKLLYLRYLGFRGCYLEELTLSCTKFLCLETLDLRVSTSCTMIIPNVLWKLSNLINLYFPVSYQSVDQAKLKLKGMTKLQVIENFHAGLCDVDDILMFNHLHIFTGTADGDAMDFDKIIAIIDGNKNLRHSLLTLLNFDCYSTHRQGLFGRVLMCNALRGLHIEGHLIRMPKDLTIAQNFIKMVFDGSEFLEDPMPILGRLPYLRDLVLRNDAIVGEEISCSGSSFEQLKSLKLGNLQYLEKWMLDSEAMPRLSVVTIEQCHKLQRLPHELMKRENLTELMIGSMPNLYEELSCQKEEGLLKITITHYDC